MIVIALMRKGEHCYVPADYQLEKVQILINATATNHSQTPKPDCSVSVTTNQTNLHPSESQHD